MPSKISITKMSYDTAHYALKVIHQGRTDLLDPAYKYLITTAKKKKRYKWDVKAWGYYQNKRYD
jgi:hypothetical protein